MTTEEIHAQLKARFGDAVAEWRAVEHGDSYIQAAPAAWHDIAGFLRDEDGLRFDFLRLISGVDRGERFSSVYHLYSYEHGHAVTLRIDVERADPRIPSVADLWPAAEWHEREAYDMMGIVYEGHENLRRILLPDDWEGFPLRKDYVPPKSYHGLTNE
ncbi:MAG: NADH-quinone oxidoreductase subunit C [Candidatus Hydrogenedentes bacterium]|nr:NADH-quinone oxidoreductase subunit C [Candidatus Hydrogenedentota bacterium]